MTTGQQHLQESEAIHRDSVDRRLIACLLAVLVVFSVRCMLVATYATAAPFWDQWDAEIDRLYRPFLDGTLGIRTWFSAHNEHRILFTRIVALALFVLNDDQFDARVQCFTNVGIFCISFIVLLRNLATALPTRTITLFLVTTILVFGSPVGWENLIAGFQNQFYMLMGLSIAAIGWASRSRGGIRDAIVLILLSLCSVFTMASGLLAAVIVAAICIARALDGTLAKRHAYGLAAIQGVIALTAYACLPHVSYLLQFKAQGAAEFLHALVIALAWPANGKLIHALIFWAPTAVLMGYALRAFLFHRRPLGQKDLALLGVALWVLAQGFALAYSRGHDMNGISSRYSDLFAVGLLNNIAIALRLLPDTPERFSSYARIVAVGFVVFSMMWFYRNLPAAMEEMGARSTAGAEQVTLLHSYLMTHDRTLLSKGVFPYPDATRIAEELDDPRVADFMPQGVRRPLPVRWVKCDGFIADGIYPGTSELRYANVLGSYVYPTGDTNQGQCLSATVTRQRHYVIFQMTGTADGASAYMDIVDGNGKSRRLAPAIAEASLGGNILRMSTPTFHMSLVDHSSTQWIATAEPVELGALSAGVERLVARPLIFLLMLVVASTTILSAVSLRRKLT